VESLEAIMSELTQNELGSVLNTNGNPAAERRHIGSPGWSEAEPGVSKGKVYTGRERMFKKVNSQFRT